jgi:hypothetical protein
MCRYCFDSIEHLRSYADRERVQPAELSVPRVSEEATATPCAVESEVRGLLRNVLLDPVLREIDLPVSFDVLLLFFSLREEGESSGMLARHRRKTAITCCAARIMYPARALPNM